MPFEIEIKEIGDEAALERALPAWREFAAGREVECGFWCDPTVVAALADFRGDSKLMLAVARTNGEPVGALPFRLANGPVSLSIGLLRIGSLRMRMAKLYDSEFAAAVGAPRTRALRAALDAVAKAEVADMVMLDNCPLAGMNNLSRRTVARNVQTTYLVDMPLDFDTYLNTLSSKTRQTLRRKVRKMERECGSQLKAKRYSEESEMRELLGHLKAVWDRSWHGKLNRQPPPGAPFLSRMAQEGWVRAYVLFAGENPVAYVQGYQYRQKFMDEAPAFDAQWASYSPGLVLNYFIFEDLFSWDRPAVVDFGFGYNQYKETLGTRGETRGQLWLPMNGRGRLGLSALRFCDLVFKCGKTLFGRTALIRTLKSRSRRFSQ